MTRKSKREIGTELDDLEHDGSNILDDVDPIAQYCSDEYPNPPMGDLAEAWRDALQPDESK